ncbi:MAG: TlpA disulfide reductase family protein [Gemmataceae bacterium]
MRALFSASLAVCLCGFATALDDKKEEPKTVAEKFKALQTEFREAASALEKEFIAAKTPEEKNAIRDKFFALRPKFAEKAVAIAATDPKDPGAFEAATFALLQFGAEGTTAEKAATIIGEHHASNPKLKSMIPNLGQNAGGQKLLKTLHEKATDKDVKGATLYFLAAGMLEEADYPRGGPPMPAEKQAAAFKEAETLLNKAGKEYGDVEITTGRGDTKSIAKAVEGQLFFLNNLTVGKVLPDAASEDLDGKKVKISDYRGKVVVLDIWATWCPPCRAMIPHERELVKNLKDKPFVFISVSADADKDTLVKFLEKEPMPWTHWWAGPKGAPIVDYRVQFYPTIYILDEKGVIRYKHVREKAMDEAIDKLLKEIKPKS